MTLTLEKFIQNYNGKFLEVAGSANAQNQCVDLANGVIRDVWGLPIIEWTNAVDFPQKLSDSYTFVANTPDGVPPSGSLIVFKKYGSLYGDAGHIALVIAATVKKVQVFEQNYPTGSPCKVGEHDYRGCVGWFFPVLKQQTSTTAVSSDSELVKILTHYHVKTADELIQSNDQQLQYLVEARADVTRLNQTVESKEITIKQISGERQAYLDQLSSILWKQGEPTLADEKSIREKVESLSKVEDLADSYRDQLEREQKAHADEVIGYKKSLSDLKTEMDAMREEYDRKLANVQSRVDEEIKRLNEAKAAYERTGGIIDWIKSIFTK